MKDDAKVLVLGSRRTELPFTDTKKIEGGVN